MHPFEIKSHYHRKKQNQKPKTTRQANCLPRSFYCFVLKFKTSLKDAVELTEPATLNSLID